MDNSTSLMIFFFVVMISEFILSGTWNKFYFTTGLPIFAAHFPVRGTNLRIPTAARIESLIPDSFFAGEMLVHYLEDDFYLFREKLIQSSFTRKGYMGFMHGNLEFDRNNREVVVAGRLNWYPIVMLGFVITYFRSVPGLPSILIPILFIGLLFGITFWMQKKRFTEVGRIAAKEWERSVQFDFNDD